MFTTFIIQPIFNLLVLIYALLPGHNFGLALIIFTVLVRVIMWPLVKRQLHQAKAMRTLQPEIKQIKKLTKGDRQKEQAMIMELYKEKGINPFASFPTLIVQFIVLIGLYIGLNRVINNSHQIISFAYPALRHLSWMQTLAHNTHLFDDTLFGLVNLSRAAVGSHGGVYWPAMVIVLGSAVAQYFQSKQLLPKSKDQRGLRAILREAGNGKQADQTEVNAAVGRSTIYILPLTIFLVSYHRPSAISLYWLVGGVVAYIQQLIALRGDEAELEAGPAAPSKNLANIPEAEIVQKPAKKPIAKSNSKKARRKNKS